MLPNKRTSPVLACFTPPVMLATFMIETALAIYVGLRFSSGVFRSLVCVLLLCLASFQLAEHQVCTGPADSAIFWGKLGLAGITLLPALGMHLIGTVTRKSLLIPVGYGLAAVYIGVFLFVPGATGTAECMGNYVIMQIDQGWFGSIYEAYYVLFVALAILELGWRLTEKQPKLGFGFSRRLIALTLAGYLSFTIPMAITGFFSPELRRATPSIMCGFALSFAVILACYVAPLYARESMELKVAPGLT